jgi:hypothetical protein
MRVFLLLLLIKLKQVNYLSYLKEANGMKKYSGALLFIGIPLMENNIGI